MKILAIDTSLGWLSLAIKTDSEVYSIKIDELNQQSKLLADEVDKLLGKADIDITEVSTILVTKGPGSFTGIRVGLAFAYGLKIIPKVEILACSTLCCLNVDYLESKYVTVNASRDSYYTQQFKDNLPIGDIEILSRSKLDLMENSQILGHYNDCNVKPDVIKMLKLYQNIDTRNILFSSNLEPHYIRETYF